MDPATLAIIANRFDTVTRAMTNTLLRTARSGVLNTARDLSCAILTADNRMLVSGESLPVHVGGLALEGEALTGLHGETVAPGDAYLNNSPYHGGTHHADHTMLVPVVVDEHHVMTVCAKAHQADIGNCQPTTYMPEASDVYQEGAVSLPCVRIQSSYRDIDDIVRICRARIRIPDQWYGDYLAAIGAARIGEQGVLALYREYGPETISEFTAAWMSYGNRQMSAAIEQLPSGRWSAETRHDPFPGAPDGVPVRVGLGIDRGRKQIEVDLTDNVDCLPCGLNLSEATARAAVITGVLTCVKERVPLNQGAIDLISIAIRNGSAIGGPREPASCSASTTNLFDRLVNAVWSAMAKVSPGVGVAGGGLGMPASYSVISGHDLRVNAPYVNQLFLGATGGPATPSCDGWLTFSMTGDVGVSYRDSVEIDEQKYPVMINRQEIMVDSEGAGEHTGAPAVVTEFGPLEGQLTAIYLSDGHVHPADGVRGGANGHPASVWKINREGEVIELPQVGEIVLGPGERLRSICAGGAGFGKPKDRARSAVERDVAEGLISPERARMIYGVDGRAKASNE